MLRRALWVLVGLLALTSALLAGGWFFWVPHYRPGLRAEESYGVDVSSHQGRIDWGAVAHDSIRFAYVKATEGGDFTDSSFVENWRGAAGAGLQRGAYHFFTLCASGAVQARHFLSVVPKGSAELPPAVDLEIAGNCHMRPPSTTVQAELATYVRIVGNATGRRVVIYLGADFADRYHFAEWASYPLWIRRFYFRPSEHNWVVWQANGFAHVDGIASRVDLDVMRAGR
jgi:lysozyme